MIKTILAVLGLVVVCLNPILSGMFLTAAATRWHAEKTIRRPRPVKKEPAPAKKQEEKGFTTIKERQEVNVKRYMKPGFENDPNWQRQTAELRKIMDENRKREQAKRDAGDWS